MRTFTATGLWLNEYHPIQQAAGGLSFVDKECIFDEQHHQPHEEMFPCIVCYYLVWREAQAGEHS
jgi:hypothetical protein